MKFFCIFIFVCASLDCDALTFNSKNDGTYTVAESYFLITGGWERAQFEAKDFAKKFCSEKKSTYLIIDEKREGTPGFTPLSTEINFRCGESENTGGIDSNNLNKDSPIGSASTEILEPSVGADHISSIAGVAASGNKRLALVIGNSSYRTRPLRNPTNDANDVSNALKSSGFQVIDLRDASLQQMRAGVRQFGDRLINNDVGLVYYSGHGVEVKGRNYLIPVNADIQREDEIADQGLDVSLVLEKMSTAGKGVNILIVDACRDDPFGRSFRSSSRGLANMDAPRGTIIAYATSPGKVAQDGDGRNSPYTKNLVRAMQQPNKPIEQVFKEVRRAVQAETKNLQTPWENTSLSGDFYFRVQK